MSDLVDDRRNEELELLRRCGSGDTEACAEMYDATCVAVYHLCLCVLGSRPAAERAARSAYVEVWDKASTVGVEGPSVTAWILGVAHRHALAQRGSAARHRAGR